MELPENLLGKQKSTQNEATLKLKQISEKPLAEANGIGAKALKGFQKFSQ